MGTRLRMSLSIRLSIIFMVLLYLISCVFPVQAKPEIQPYLPQQGEILFQDDFSDPNSG